METTIPVKSIKNIPARSAGITAVCLALGMVLTFVVGSLVFESLPGHLRESTRTLITVIPALAALIGSGALWGRAMARLAGAVNVRRAAWAGGLSLGPLVILTAIGLGSLEVLLVEERAVDLPIHNVFTLLFVPAAFLVAGLTSLALGIGLGDRRLAWRMALAAALAGGLAFLAVNLTLQSFGFVVGGPGAAERATMILTLFAGMLGAALAGGWVIGRMISPGEASTEIAT